MKVEIHAAQFMDILVSNGWKIEMTSSGGFTSTKNNWCWIWSWEQCRPECLAQMYETYITHIQGPQSGVST